MSLAIYKISISLYSECQYKSIAELVKLATYYVTNRQMAKSWANTGVVYLSRFSFSILSESTTSQ